MTKVNVIDDTYPEEKNMSEHDKFIKGLDYCKKEGDQNTVCALHYLRKAAEPDGHSCAQYHYGLICYKGMPEREVPKEGIYTTLMYLERAAEKNHAGALYYLGLMYYHGEKDESMELNQDCNQALDFFYKSAEQGHVEAQYCLGLMYKKGEGTKANMREAYIWLRIAKENGCELAERELSAIHQHLGDDKESARQEAVRRYNNRGAKVPDKCSYTNEIGFRSCPFCFDQSKNK